MIFVTVGTDQPFDRLVKVVDRWARDHQRTDVFAQIGRTSWRPAHIPHTQFLDPDEFNRRFRAATVIVAHAGMGTILSALRFEKPILVMPRRASLGEHRNEHQLATAQRLLELDKVNVAFSTEELVAVLDRLENITTRGSTGPFASTALIGAVRDFIHSDPPWAPVKHPPIVQSGEGNRLSPQ